VHQSELQRICIADQLSISNNEWFLKYKTIMKNYPEHALLESGRGGRYHIIGLSPVATLKGKDNQLTISTEIGIEVKSGDPLYLMKEWMAKYKTEKNDDYPDFQGGAIGFVSYDYVRSIERIPALSKDDLDTPDLYFYVFNDVFVYDTLEETMWIMTHGNKGDEASLEERLADLKEIWSQTQVETECSLQLRASNSAEREVSMDELMFTQSVSQVQEYIGTGDVFQVNLSVRQSEKLLTSPFHIYEKLREINPSPYMGYLQFPEFQLVSGSPELLVKKDGYKVSTRPIAGTRSRGGNEEEDIALAKELIENEKERAEHVMLVDLERNDLGRVCKYGTVEVDEFMVIEKYSHVMHIVSNVSGELDEQHNEYDLIRAVFPGGTITGAPKIRTMEIIEELEPVRRGVYTGSVGWIGFNGDVELNISIRTMVVKDEEVHVQAGAGIVIDSNPHAEYKESLKKARALWSAKELSEQEAGKSNEV
jgi:para-aminobenzoate synthetase component I